ncbi:unknown protein [Seminavis robusta]|uniref:Uncharacterized protein n=1 Tax=Seminavis robusta TaxID=568900 RepID=A0A9N8F0T6_9STRA|nr:unknown protein [Seminavis robusta]|eukprot:Sro3029_g342491.1  (230) ;mRNA; r:6433-7226
MVLPGFYYDRFIQKVSDGGEKMMRYHDAGGSDYHAIDPQVSSESRLSIAVIILAVLYLAAVSMKYRRTFSSLLWGPTNTGTARKNGMVNSSYCGRMTWKGFNTMLAYFSMSNACAILLVTFSWYRFSVQHGSSPLYPGQWSAFVVLCSDMAKADKALQPIRLALAVLFAPRADKAMKWIQDQTGSYRLAIDVALIGIGAATLGLLIGGIVLASWLARVPIFLIDSVCLP